MRRRSRASGKPIKTRRRKAATLGRPNAPKVSGRRKHSSTNANTENALLKRERDEALEQLSAASEVLKVISSSPGDLKPVFEAILQKATRICEANFGILFRLDDGVVHVGATLGVPLALAKFMQSVRRPGPHSATARAMRTGQVIHILDVREERGYREGDPMLVFGADKVGLRTLVAAPMLKDKVPIGSIGIYRTEVRPFTDKQIELLRNFAAQAVIAIENTRLLNELRQRTDDLTESLEQQTATSEVLKVISTSPGELEAVFQSVLEKAVRLCDATFGVMYRYDDRDRTYTAVALFGAPAALQENYGKQGAFTPAPGSSLDHIARTGGVVNKADASAEPAPGAPVIFGGARSLTCVPMTKDSRLIGAITIYRQEVRPFTDKQVELVQNFAAQAVIAIENTRLLNELRQRTDDLSESLQQQTATADVLKVISSSPGELEPVFQAMLENATRICGASFGNLDLREGEVFRLAAMYNAPPAFAEQRRAASVLQVNPRGALGRVVAERRFVQIEDMAEHPLYKEQVSQYVDLVEKAKARTLLVAPLLKEDEVVGVFAIYRQEVRPFTEKQIELVQNFAAQAVIAIENTRLLNELRQSLEQQTATANVLSVISSSPGDLEPVFQTMLENAIHICEAKFGNLFLINGEGCRWAAGMGTPPKLAEYFTERSLFRPTPGSHLDRVMRTKQVSHTADDTKEAVIGAAARLGGARSTVCVPMLKDDVLVGAIFIYRTEVRPFTDKQIALVQNFAAQAVIAIENTRLLNELRESLEQQTATSEVLSVISSSPGDLVPVFGSMLENAVRICDASFGNFLLFENGVFRHVALHNAPEAWAADQQHDPIAPRRSARLLYRIAETKQVTHIADMASENPEEPIAKVAGARTVLIVPMLKETELVGVIAIYRREVRPFTDRQIELLTNFAAQAVIAIENTRLLNELRQRTDDLTESLQQQTATSEVLQVISKSPGELEPVFQSMLENATRICEAEFGVLYRFDGEAFHFAAEVGAPPDYAEFNRRRGPFQPIPGGQLERVMLTKGVSHTADDAASAIPGIAARLADARTQVIVPMLKEDELVGAIIIYRQEVRPFTDKQIELVQNFAAQAVIAIENARLLNELRQRTDDLTESLEQQTATSEVLQAISSTPGELHSVFGAMLTNAMRICRAQFGNLLLYDGDQFRRVALHGVPADFAKSWLEGLKPSPHSALGRLLSTKQVVHVPDTRADQAYAERDPLRVATVKILGARTFLAVPMLKDDKVIGAITIYRQEVLPFTEKQTGLVQNFAAQAVIAIENTRLLNELRQRTTDLTESLDQQTATSEVLRVISSSPGELEPVFQTVLEKATRICDAEFGTLFRFDGELFHPAAQVGTPTELVEFQKRRGPFQPPPGSGLERVVLAKQVTQTADDAAVAAPGVAAKLGGARSIVYVPMLKDDVLIGIIVIYRQEVRPFTEKQIALVQNFAAQAVIAIENTRLLNELRQSLEQQTATADVLRVISSSPGELEPVFRAMLENATHICEAKFGVLYLFDGEMLTVGAEVETPPKYAEFQKQRGRFQPTRGGYLERVLRTKQTDYTADAAAGNVSLPVATVGGARSLVCVPMLKDDGVVGIIAIYRQEVRPFSDKQIELVQNFAAQAVIAIENTRLLSELRQSLQQQTATADVLKIISRSTFDLQHVLQTLVESAARLCEAEKSTITRQRGNVFYRAESYGFSSEFMDYVKDIPVEPERSTAAGRALLEGRAIHIADVKSDPEYTFEAQKFDAYRTILGVPMLREGVPIGVLTLIRSEVRPFTDKQIELVSTFADQAAIAIENVRLFDEIQDKSRQLEVASQHKSQFLANMSHELRTPLNAILGYTELMADGIYGELPEKTMGVLKRLESNGRHLLGLINDVLDLSKIEAGQLVLELTDYSLEDIAQTVRSTLEPLAADKKLAFKVDVAPKLPAGHGDGRRLTQVVINLVGNAIKFTDAGEVVIKATATDGSFHLSVRDTGPGISAADQAKLFQEFQQADNAITRKKGGTGLGLAISKRIVEMHGGEIWLESQVGQGSTFSFTVPVRVERQVEPA